MYIGLLHTHGLLRYIILILLLVVIVKAMIGYFGKKSFTKVDDKLSLTLFISSHLQLVIGLVLYFVSPYVRFGEGVMKDATARYWTVEHIAIMLLAIVMISVARIRAKKQAEHHAKFRTMLWYNLSALVLILAAIIQSGRGII